MYGRLAHDRDRRIMSSDLLRHFSSFWRIYAPWSNPKKKQVRLLQIGAIISVTNLKYGVHEFYIFE